MLAIHFCLFIREGDKKLLDLPRVAFSGKHESPALSKWEELEALLTHVQDPGEIWAGCPCERWPLDNAGLIRLPLSVSSRDSRYLP